MENSLNRKDFLKLLSLLPPALSLPPKLTQPSGESNPELPNIIIMVYDAWSASNVPLYGYPRDTMPFLTKLAEKAIVYHNHYAGAMFTYPGTTSLLTGTLNWKHQAYYYNKDIDPFYHQNNIFSLLENYYRITYTHNTIARLVLREMAANFDQYLEHHHLYLKKHIFSPTLFQEDYDIASVSWQRALKSVDDGYANSPFISRILKYYSEKAFQQIAKDFPIGIPAIEGDNYFLLEDATGWIIEKCTSIPSPYFGYFHLLPPHSPYRTRKEYYHHFKNDEYIHPEKPEHIFSSHESRKELLANRLAYDEYLLYVDKEFNRLYSQLEKVGVLKNTWIFLTSDHGEMFERGIKAHGVYALFDPLMKVPLLIFPPDQSERLDVHDPTSAVDLLPTIMQITGQPIPNWLEGVPLPPFNPINSVDRTIYAMDTRFSQQYQTLTDASIMMRKGPNKLIYSFGTANRYKRLNGDPLYELFNIDQDPEELRNLVKTQPEILSALQAEINAKINEMDPSL